MAYTPQGRKIPKPRKHRFVIDIALNEGFDREEIAALLQDHLDRWLDESLGGRAGGIYRSITVQVAA